MWSPSRQDILLGDDGIGAGGIGAPVGSETCGPRCCSAGRSRRCGPRGDGARLLRSRAGDPRPPGSDRVDGVIRPSRCRRSRSGGGTVCLDRAGRVTRPATSTERSTSSVSAMGRASAEPGGRKRPGPPRTRSTHCRGSAHASVAGLRATLRHLASARPVRVDLQPARSSRPPARDFALPRAERLLLSRVPRPATDHGRKIRPTCRRRNRARVRGFGSGPDHDGNAASRPPSPPGRAARGLRPPPCRTCSRSSRSGSASSERATCPFTSASAASSSRHPLAPGPRSSNRSVRSPVVQLFQRDIATTGRLPTHTGCCKLLEERESASGIH